MTSARTVWSSSPSRCSGDRFISLRALNVSSRWLESMKWTVPLINPACSAIGLTPMRNPKLSKGNSTDGTVTRLGAAPAATPAAPLAAQRHPASAARSNGARTVGTWDMD